jgi:hypothetical protein
MCSEATFSLAPGSKESVPQTNENLNFKRIDFKSQAEGFANFLKPESSA